MIESPRRHGPFDPRYGPFDRGCRDDADEDGLVARASGHADEDELAVQIREHVALRVALEQPALVHAARTDDGGLATDAWEDEGGSYSVAVEPALASDRVSREEAPAGLDWYAFLTHSFPGRRRHDLKALEAYAAYRSSAVAEAQVRARHD